MYKIQRVGFPISLKISAKHIKILKSHACSEFEFAGPLFSGTSTHKKKKKKMRPPLPSKSNIESPILFSNKNQTLTTMNIYNSDKTGYTAGMPNIYLITMHIYSSIDTEASSESRLRHNAAIVSTKAHKTHYIQHAAECLSHTRAADKIKSSSVSPISRESRMCSFIALAVRRKRLGRTDVQVRCAST